jgi:hypothetical protein
MKYRTFRNLVLLGGTTALAGLGATCYHFSGGNQTGHTQTVTRTAPAPPPTVSGGGVNVISQTQYPAGRTPSAPAGPATQSQSVPRREDRLILDFLAAHPATTDKVKDAFPGESFKVNFYRDAGSPTWTRIKIDSDRDGKDDEKWDLKDGQLAKRRIATRDDEQYDREYRWRNSQWVEKK